MMPDGPITLAIETSNPSATPGGGAVALVGATAGAECEAIAMSNLDPESRRDDALLRAIERVCDQASLAPKAIDRVAVSIGPGGYTALRIAVTAAKTIAKACGASLHPGPTAHALVRRIGDPDRATRQTTVCLAWKRDDVWTQTFEPGDPPGEPSEPGVVPLESIKSYGGRLILAEPRLQSELIERQIVDQTWRFIEPRFDPVAVAEVSLGVEPIDPVSLVPFYPREPEAVSNWRRLHGGG